MQPEPLAVVPTTPMIAIDDSSLTLLRDPVQPCHVLLVDDDELVREQLAALLYLGGYEVHAAGSGEEALRILDTAPCQIVLTDWQMPDMDGIALCRSLRRRDSSAYTYILMLTVRDGRSDILAGLAAGADDYVVKGATAEEILARLDVGRRITRLEQSLRASNAENRLMSVTDPLTGAHNRRFLMKYLPRELERARRYNHPLAILSCDVDYFKRINDGFGHDAGDEVLQAFVSRAGTCIRQAIDWISRSGGEEFILVLPETNLSGATRVAERLRRVLAAQAISTCAGPIAITVSIGVSALETAEERTNSSVASLLHTADRCLYISKELGRDRATAARVNAVGAVMSEVHRGANDEIH